MRVVVYKGQNRAGFFCHLIRLELLCAGRNRSVKVVAAREKGNLLYIARCYTCFPRELQEKRCRKKVTV